MMSSGGVMTLSYKQVLWKCFRRETPIILTGPCFSFGNQNRLRMLLCRQIPCLAKLRKGGSKVCEEQTTCTLVDNCGSCLGHIGHIFILPGKEKYMFILGLNALASILYYK